MTDELRKTLDEFKDKVNATASKLEDWLETENQKISDRKTTASKVSDIVRAGKLSKS